MITHKGANLPNFLIVGAHKAGTTSIYHYLKQHPEVLMSSIKEPNFIASPFLEPRRDVIGNFKKPDSLIKALEDYRRLFRGANGERAIGEASVSNLYCGEKAIPYIKKFLGEPKIIIILRDPVERAFSAYSQLLFEKREHLTFEEALEQEEKRISDGFWFVYSYKKMGHYYSPVKAYMDNFKDVKVYLFEELANDSQALMRDMYAFLGIDDTFVPDTNIRYNVSGAPTVSVLGAFLRPGIVRDIAGSVAKFVLPQEKWSALRSGVTNTFLSKSEMKPETRQFLKDFYREDTVKLEGLIGRDLSHWRNG